MLLEGLVIAAGVALFGFALSRVRGARAAKVERRTLGQHPRLLPAGEYLAWPVRSLAIARRPSRVVVERGQVTWFAPDRLQPDWQAAAHDLSVREVPATLWVGLDRVRLQPPAGKPVTVLVSRESQRPAGPLDPDYEARLRIHLSFFLESLRSHESSAG